jgi:transcriptional regulator GlxA family with amidase domain
MMGAVEGPHKLFTEVNEILERLERPRLFEVQLVGLGRETKLNGGLFTVHPHLTIHEVKKTDLVIIPAVHGDQEKALADNEGFVPWITAQYRSGAEVASLCLGAFLLAATGLLKGRKCATHWMSATEFRSMFPDVDLVAEKIITDEQGIYSSGGAYSYLNLILYLIEKHAGRDVAIMAAKVFAIEIDRHSQSPFTMFKGQKDHADEHIRRAQEYIEKNFQEKITVEEIASMLALGRRNLERRFKKATANSIMEYIQRVKIEAAKLSLESSRENVNEVMYKVGYADRKAFRTTFKKITGLSPVQYRNKYNREAAA